MNRFTLTPTLYNKLIGRGMSLICSSPHCLHATEGHHDDKEWDNKISPQGYGKCPRCGTKTDTAFFEHDVKKALEMAHDPKCQFRPKAKLILPKCVSCGCIMSKEQIIYTQEVVSKHRKSNHYYYHADCYDAMFLAEDGSNPLFNKKKYKMRYAGAHGHGCVVNLPFDPRKGVCSACGKSRHVFDVDGKPEIKLTSSHHWKYAYQPDTVLKNPILILDNTSELCFACHQIADGLRNILRMSPDRAVKVTMLMPKDLRATFYILCRKYIEAYEKDG